MSAKARKSKAASGNGMAVGDGELAKLSTCAKHTGKHGSLADSLQLLTSVITSGLSAGKAVDSYIGNCSL